MMTTVWQEKIFISIDFFLTLKKYVFSIQNKLIDIMKYLLLLIF